MDDLCATTAVREQRRAVARWHSGLDAMGGFNHLMSSDWASEEQSLGIYLDDDLCLATYGRSS